MTQLLRRLFTVQEYHRMAEAGILREDDRLELLRGEIVQMSPIGSRHAATVNRINRLFFRKFGDRALPSIQNPVELDDYSEPQPDIALLRPRDDCYEAGHPLPEDVLLLVEVADSTLRLDRTVKIPLYAEDGIAEVWLIDLKANCIEVYRQPTAKGYQQVERFTGQQSFSIQAFADVEIAVSEVLGSG
ncbi:Uma2 family endonuclease [Microcoleus sp. FACHB-1515]|uniref:Uma2 family endonuclease n=1 Tax=Cyanophyceae TaxID=3028117 RepID=UPI001689B214|nr:Uma2 family endonuclease [Microcoleus sp. FACHB-1515]MBD2092133.1 Uma2 family endonuclease [Microcoleus sp. FACHB-1515]